MNREVANYGKGFWSGVAQNTDFFGQKDAVNNALGQYLRVAANYYASAPSQKIQADFKQAAQDIQKQAANFQHLTPQEQAYIVGRIAGAAWSGLTVKGVAAMVDIESNRLLHEQGTALGRLISNSPWSYPAVTRGQLIEKSLGGNLPPNYPTIDYFDSYTGRVASIKSLDLLTKTYSDPNKLRSKIKGYIDQVAAFNGNTKSTPRITPENIQTRQLVLAIPAGVVTQSQADVLNDLANYAANNQVIYTVVQIQ